MASNSSSAVQHRLDAEGGQGSGRRRDDPADGAVRSPVRATGPPANIATTGLRKSRCNVGHGRVGRENDVAGGDERHHLARAGGFVHPYRAGLPNAPLALLVDRSAEDQYLQVRKSLEYPPDCCYVMLLRPAAPRRLSGNVYRQPARRPRPSSAVLALSPILQKASAAESSAGCR